MLFTALTRWSLRDAKARFNELVRRAVAAGSRMVMRGRAETVVVTSARDYAGLTVPEQSLADFLRQSPLADVMLDVARRRDVGRTLSL